MSATPGILGAFHADLARSWAEVQIGEDLEAHWQAMAAVDKAIVLAFDAPASGIMVPNDYVAGYVSEPPGKARRLRQRRPGQA